jgi:hypothetical protein
LLLLAVAGACRGGSGGGPPYLEVELAVAETFPAARIAAADLEIQPTAEPGATFADATSFATLGGVRVLVRAEAPGANGRRGLLVSFARSPFRGLRAQLYLYPRLLPAAGIASTAGAPLTTPPMQVTARLYTADGQVLATAAATLDVDGNAIRLGDKDRRVLLSLRCDTGPVCTESTAPPPPGQAKARVRVTRAPACPTAAALRGEVHVFLFPNDAQGTAVSAAKTNVDFTANDAEATLDLPATTPGSYVAVAFLRLGGVASPTPGDGDLVSRMCPVDLVTDRITTADLVLSQVQGVGACRGAPPGCTSPSQPSTCAAPTGGPTMHGGTLNHDEVWTAAGSPHLVTSSVVVAGPLSPTLTIEPCAEVRIAAQSALQIGQTGNAATLVAVGTETEPIRFVRKDATAWNQIRSATRRRGSRR